MSLGLDPIQLNGLYNSAVNGAVLAAGGRSRYTAEVGIRDYDAGLERHYGRDVSSLGIDGRFRHFGLVIDFEILTEIELHDDERTLDDGVRALVARYGPVLFRNAYLPDRVREGGQRNVFSSLSFHLDRGSTQADHYSMFWRDPFDPETRQPRTSSTLILSNPAAYLQALREGEQPHAFKRRYELFQPRVPEEIVGRVAFELPWSAPDGTGEIAVLDNRTVLHASYYPRAEDRGYPIAVRYLY